MGKGEFKKVGWKKQHFFFFRQSLSLHSAACCAQCSMWPYEYSWSLIYLDHNCSIAKIPRDNFFGANAEKRSTWRCARTCQTTVSISAAGCPIALWQPENRPIQNWAGHYLKPKPYKLALDKMFNKLFANIVPPINCLEYKFSYN